MTVFVALLDIKTAQAVDPKGNASAKLLTAGTGIKQAAHRRYRHQLQPEQYTSRTTTTATGSYTNYYEADNHLTHDTWLDNELNTSGSDTFNASGLTLRRAVVSDLHACA